MKTKNRNEQEKFWAGNFGDQYISRNSSSMLVESNLRMFKRIFRNKKIPNDCIELGANIGLNLKALKKISPDMKINAIEINKKAIMQLKKILPTKNIFEGSITEKNIEFLKNKKFELVFTKTVLIHINPKLLKDVYELIYNISSKFILFCEYYNPSPTNVIYRNNTNKLFKRDFAGEFLDIYKDTKLVDYGFVYHRDNCHPQDDISWFLLKK